MFIEFHITAINATIVGSTTITAASIKEIVVWKVPNAIWLV